MLASAVLVKQSQIRAIPEQRDWQTRAWDYYDRVPELRFAVQWIANALSRCRLYVGLPNEFARAPEPVRPDGGDTANPDGVDGRARVPLDELFGGASGQSDMLSRLAMHLTVVGESYLIAFDDTETRQRRWMVASSEEFSRTGGGQVRLRLPESDTEVRVSLKNTTVIRLWRQHPRRAWEADSPVRASLGVLKELVDLSAHISATVESRLAGAGMLFVPESATMPSPLNDQSQPMHEDSAMSTLIDSMVTPISDRDAASAVVPIICRIPDQATGKPEWMSFSTPFDERVQELRDSAINRFASAVDIPKEVLQGYGDSNRWNAWKVSEDAITLHLEPLLNLIADALTQQYLWPALEAMGIADPDQYVIWYDASDLIQRPNRGPESQNLYEHGLVDSATVRHANGFADEDAPDADEQRTILLTQLASKGIDPVLAQPYLKALGIELDLSDTPSSDGQDTPQRDQDDRAAPEGSRIRGRPPNPTRLPTRPEPLPANPDTVDRTEVVGAADEQQDLSFAAVEYGAVHALSHAGKRLTRNLTRSGRSELLQLDPWNRHTHAPPVTDVDSVLEGAYTELRTCLSHAPQVQHVIDNYVRERLHTRQPHDRSVLLSRLVQSNCLTSPGTRRVSA